MEQKRTLWIVAAAGIFLLVVFGAALIIYSKPLNQSSAVQAGYDPYSGWNVSTNQTVNPVTDSKVNFTNDFSDTTKSPVATLTPSPFTTTDSTTAVDSTSGQQFHSDKVTVVTDNATVYSNETTTIDLNSLKTSSASGVIAKNEMTANQINNNRHTESSVETQSAKKESAETNYYTPVPVSKPVVAKQNTAKPKSASSSTAKSQPVQKSKTASAVASSAKKAGDTFWVQAAAYSSKRNADDARTTLESNKIPSEVFTFTDSNGKTFYRVRVGPYITKSEAEYWQTRIAMIDKFASSKSVIVSTAVN